MLHTFPLAITILRLLVLPERSIAREAHSSFGARRDVVITLSVLQMQGQSVTDLITSRTNLKIEEDAEHGEWFRVCWSDKLIESQ